MPRPPASYSRGTIRTAGHRPIRTPELGLVRRPHRACRPPLRVRRGAGGHRRRSALRTAATRRAKPNAAAGDLVWVRRSSWFWSCRSQGCDHGTQTAILEALYCNIKFRCRKPRRGFQSKPPIQSLLNDMTTSGTQIMRFSDKPRKMYIMRHHWISSSQSVMRARVCQD